MQAKDEWVNKNGERKRLRNIATDAIHKRIKDVIRKMYFDKMHKI